ICWEDFEAPEWCVPIKANVLTFEWDVITVANRAQIINNYTF
ncbi:10521_t:CDS:2, partial [Rhizophagus irregularis]